QSRRDTDRHGQDVPAEDLGTGHRDVLEPSVIRDEQRVNGIVRRGHNKFWYVAQPDEKVPSNHQREVTEDRERITMHGLQTGSQRFLLPSTWPRHGKARKDREPLPRRA